MATDSGNDIQQFNKSLNQDVAGPFIPKNAWTHARNCINNSSSGDLGDLGNEPANKHLIDAPYPIIGSVYLYDDNWVIYSTSDTASEIGTFKESTAVYVKVVRDSTNVCLNFSKGSLITGVSRKNFDCSWSTYWSDHYRNPDRFLNLSNIPYVGVTTFDTNGCAVFTPSQPLTLDCIRLRLNREISVPCIKTAKGASGGSLLNGSYYATLAYSINGQPVTEFLGLSNVCSLFEHLNLGSALDINISGLDTTYDEYVLIIVSIINQQTVARRLGTYSTTQNHVSLDIISNELPVVPLEFIPIHSPLMESSASITELSDHLLRIAPKTKFDPNYQPLANQINSFWQSTEYPADYYRDGGTNPNFLRDENVALFIRWLYDDGDKTSCYHIPGRAPLSGERAFVTGIYPNTQQFENVNSAAITATHIGGSAISTGDGGYVIAEGTMGYYETEELYPVDKPEVWGSLCGKNIRHHKFPDRALSVYTDIYSDLAVSPITIPVIRIMGLKLTNIKGPVDNQGNPIKNIVGYEILRGSREGNKTIMAKGIVNNTFTYQLTDGSGKTGIYPNYPFNSLENDFFISTTKTSTNASGVIQNVNYNTFDAGNKIVTFHSPDTNFRKPFLSARELKLDGIVSGTANLQFKYPDHHPKHKLLRNSAYFTAAVGGIGLAVIKMNGVRTTDVVSPSIQGTTGVTAFSPAAIAASGAAETGATTVTNIVEDVYSSFGDIVQARDNTVNPLRDTVLKILDAAAKTTTIFSGGTKQTTYQGGLGSAIGSFYRSLAGLPLFVNYWGEGTDEVLNLLRNFSKYQQYGLQQTSHCFYNTYSRPTPSRIYINNAQYLGSGFQDFDVNTKINNLNRISTVTLGINNQVPDPASFNILLKDKSRQTLQTISGADYTDPITAITPRVASSYYASLKLRLRNQYGQIGDVKQIPIGCINRVVMDEVVAANNVFVSPVIFGGDTYVTRYTEKNTMFFFYEWLYEQLDGFEYDYFSRRMLQYPVYWANTEKFDTGDFLSGISTTLGGSVTNIISSITLSTLLGGSISPPSNTSPTNFSTNVPTTLRALDSPASPNGDFVIKDSYFYVSSSGVRDFYVEAEVNVGYRDWEDPIIKRHYDVKTFTEIPRMFDANPAVLKSDNFYKYDYSLSISRSFVNMISWGNVQPPYYNPTLAETCFTQHLGRVIYSLPQQSELIRDNWRTFLVNNYRDFRSPITTVESIGLTGAIIFFTTDSPLQIQGVETLNTSAGTKITIGDGELLQQPSQNLTNADRPYQYGSCKDLRSVINTPAGLFWMCPDQGKIFTVGEGVLNIAMQEMNWWFIKYLPYQLLKTFPNFDLTSSPLVGIGCQSSYDNENGIIYFSKKDYRVRDEYNDTKGYNIKYTPGLGFQLCLVDTPIYTVYLTEDVYFENLSWTVSYDVKTKQWLSWHDWFPDLAIPSKNTFLTTKNGGIWKHNIRCDLYCNYYGVQYPWEVEYEHHTGIRVNTIRSIEYYLEAYKYAANCYDRYLYLNENFDEAIISNNEQCSGLLKLHLADFNNPFTQLSYPTFNLSTVDILYSMVENKYRFDMFYDLTDDRGMFDNSRRMIWNTKGNGYVRDLNDQNLNYQKLPTEMKRFRGNTSYVWLSRTNCGNIKFLMLFSDTKLLESKR